MINPLKSLFVGFILIVAGGALTPSALLANELSKSEKGLVARVENQIKMMTPQVEKYATNGREVSERVKARFARKIKKIEADANALKTTSHPDVQAARNSLAELKKKVAALSDIQDPSASFKVEMTSEEMTTHKKVIGLAGGGILSLKPALYAAGGNENLVSSLKMFGELWPKTKAAIEPIVTHPQYDAAWAKNREQRRLLGSLKNDYQAAVASYQAYEQQASTALAEWEQKVKQAVDQAIANQDVVALTDQFAPVQKNLVALNDFSDGMGAVLPQQKSKAEQAKRSAEQYYQSAVSKLSRIILEERQTPEEKYSGSDSREIKDWLENDWQQRFPQDKIVRVIIREPNWTKVDKKEWRVEGSHLVGTPKSYSKILCMVVVDHSADELALYSATVFKNHLSNNALTMDYFRPDQLTAADKMLKKNFK